MFSSANAEHVLDAFVEHDKEFSFNHRTIADVGIDTICSFLLDKTQITKGVFQFCKFTNQELATLIKKNLSLTSLDCTNPTPFRDSENIVDLAVAITKNTTLHELKLPSLGMQCFFPIVGEALNFNKHLTSLALTLHQDPNDSNMLETQDMCSESITFLIVNNRRLECLQFHGNFMDESVLIKIFCALAENKKLTELKLHDVKKISDTAIKALVVATNHRRRPLKLTLNYTPEISEEGANALLESKYIISLKFSRLDGISADLRNKIIKKIHENDVKHNKKLDIDTSIGMFGGKIMHRRGSGSASPAPTPPSSPKSSLR
jgi:hypothetical protein